eukprot:PhF_6_TR18884/c0_g1_i2/m.27500
MNPRPSSRSRRLSCEYSKWDDVYSSNSFVARCRARAHVSRPPSSSSSNVLPPVSTPNKQSPKRFSVLQTGRNTLLRSEVTTISSNPFVVNVTPLKGEAPPSALVSPPKILREKTMEGEVLAIQEGPSALLSNSTVVLQPDMTIARVVSFDPDVTDCFENVNMELVAEASTDYLEMSTISNTRFDSSANFTTALESRMSQYESDRTKSRNYEKISRRQALADPEDIYKSVTFAITKAQGAIMLRPLKRVQPRIQSFRDKKVNTVEMEAEARRIHEMELRHRLVMLKWKRAVGKVILQNRTQANRLAGAASELLARLKKEKEKRDREYELRILAQKRADETIGFFEKFTVRGKKQLRVDGLTETLYAMLFKRFRDMDIQKVNRVHLSDVQTICLEGGKEFPQRSFYRIDREMTGSFTFNDLMRCLFPDVTNRQLRTLQQIFDREAKKEAPPTLAPHAIEVLAPEHVADILEVFKRCDKNMKGIIYKEDVIRCLPDPFMIPQLGLDVLFPNQHSTLTLKDFVDVMKYSYPPYSDELEVKWN